MNLHDSGVSMSKMLGKGGFEKRSVSMTCIVSVLLRILNGFFSNCCLYRPAFVFTLGILQSIMSHPPVSVHDFIPLYKEM